jgi:hypothetical protein
MAIMPGDQQLSAPKQFRMFRECGLVLWQLQCAEAIHFRMTGSVIRNAAAGARPVGDTGTTSPHDRLFVQHTRR